MKCPLHSRNFVLWSDPCVKKRIPDFFQRIHKVAELIALEAEITSLGKVETLQTKEKWGSTHVYYTSSVGSNVNEGTVLASPVWIAEEEKILLFPEKMINTNWSFLESMARKVLSPYIGKALPISGRILYGFNKSGEVIVSHQSNVYIWKAMQRQRRLNPDLAHYIIDFVPYECNCKDDFFCEKYARVNILQKIFDRLILILLFIYRDYLRKIIKRN